MFFFWPSVWQTIIIIWQSLTKQLYDSPGHEGGILNDKKMLINKIWMQNFKKDGSRLFPAREYKFSNITPNAEINIYEL